MAVCSAPPAAEIDLSCLIAEQKDTEARVTSCRMRGGWLALAELVGKLSKLVMLPEIRTEARERSETSILNCKLVLVAYRRALRLRQSTLCPAI